MGYPETCIPRTTAARHATRRFDTPTDSVAATRLNVAPEIFRAITRTVSSDQAAVLSSMNRVDHTGGACAKSPVHAPLTLTSISEVAPGARLGRSQDTAAANSRCPTGAEGQAKSSRHHLMKLLPPLMLLSCW